MSAAPVEFVNTGRILTCLAPVNLGGGRDGSGNITLDWNRRSRLPSTMFGDPPLGEATEQYQVQLYSDGSYSLIVLTYNPIAQSQFVSTADQVSVFGGLVTVGNLHWDVAQLGQLGYGYAARGIT